MNGRHLLLGAVLLGTGYAAYAAVTQFNSRNTNTASENPVDDTQNADQSAVRLESGLMPSRAPQIYSAAQLEIMLSQPERYLENAEACEQMAAHISTQWFAYPKMTQKKFPQLQAFYMGELTRHRLLSRLTTYQIATLIKNDRHMLTIFFEENMPHRTTASDVKERFKHVIEILDFSSQDIADVACEKLVSDKLIKYLNLGQGSLSNLVKFGKLEWITKHKEQFEKAYQPLALSSHQGVSVASPSSALQMAGKQVTNDGSSAIFIGAAPPPPPPVPSFAQAVAPKAKSDLAATINFALPNPAAASSSASSSVVASRPSTSQLLDGMRKLKKVSVADRPALSFVSAKPLIVPVQMSEAKTVLDVSIPDDLQPYFKHYQAVEIFKRAAAKENERQIFELVRAIITADVNNNETRHGVDLNAAANTVSSKHDEFFDKNVAYKNLITLLGATYKEKFSIDLYVSLMMSRKRKIQSESMVARPADRSAAASVPVLFKTPIQAPTPVPASVDMAQLEKAEDDEKPERRVRVRRRKV